MPIKSGLEARCSTTFLSPCTLLQFTSLNKVISMKALKTMVNNCVGSESVVTSMNFSILHISPASEARQVEVEGRLCPAKRSANSTASWKSAWEKMFLAMVGLMRKAVLPYGALFSSSGVGSSVARARAARVSMIKFT